MSQASTISGPSTQGSTSVQTSVIAVYPDHESAERAVKLLNKEGIPMSSLSIVGRDFQVSEKPIGFATPGYFAKEGASTGALVGGLFGMLMGAAFLVLPGVGPMVVAGPLVGALLGGLEGLIAGAAFGALSGALIGWGIPKDQALLYETEVKAGKFLLIYRGDPESAARAKALLKTSSPERLDSYDDTATAA